MAASRCIALVVFAAMLLGVAGEAEAQRRRGRRVRRPREDAPQVAEPTTEAETTQVAPPPDPFAEPPPAGATTTTTTTAPTTTTTTTSAGTVAPAQRPPTVATDAMDPGPTPPDLAPLRAEYVAIMDEMVQARSRVAILGQALFQTRMTVQLQDRTGDEATLSRFVLELDGTPIYNTEGEIESGDQGRQVFEGALAPGPHVLTLDLEQRAREDTEYRVSQRESFRFIVVRERLTEVTIVLEDDSDIARSFASGGEGRFEIRTRLRVATRALPGS